MKKFKMLLLLILTGLCFSSLLNLDSNVCYALYVNEYRIDSNTIALYHFENQVDGIIQDVNELNNGSINGNAQIVEDGYFYNGIYLDGNGDYVRIDNIHTKNHTSTQTGTIDFWFKLTETPNSNFVIISATEEYEANSDTGFYLGRHAGHGQTLMFGLFGTDSRWKFAVSDIKPEKIVGEWHHVAGTWGAKGTELWFDGVKVATNTYTGDFYNSNYSAIIIGSNSYAWDTAVYIDELRISNIQRVFDKNINCTLNDNDNDGVIDQWDNCPKTPINSIVNKLGCTIQGLYTEEQMNQMVSSILSWGDTNGDNKINLIEAIKALRITSGVTEPSHK
ncbi:conserved hypothetical protein, secreted [Candidatus Magnetomorum sp. HK-1]|nr:conserved hypothetical protein, secreted [Candidatus Magnetomorum sp. HK-1]